MVIPRPTTRLLALLELLQARDSISGAELARRLEVNGRSVRRYIAMLEEIGIPVEAARGAAAAIGCAPATSSRRSSSPTRRRSRWRWRSRACRASASPSRPAAVTGARAKLERVLPLGLRERVRALEGSVALEPGPADRPGGGRAGGDPGRGGGARAAGAAALPLGAGRGDRADWSIPTA